MFDEDCFRDAARELAECPEVAIIQHESGQFSMAVLVQTVLTEFGIRRYAGREALL